MSVALNHIIIPSKDKWAAARFLADILGTIAGPEWGPFVSVQVDLRPRRLPTSKHCGDVSPPRDRETMNKLWASET